MDHEHPEHDRLNDARAAAPSEMRALVDEHNRLVETDRSQMSLDEVLSNINACWGTLQRIMDWSRRHPNIRVTNPATAARFIFNGTLHYLPPYKPTATGGMLVAVVDTETTGLSETDEPISVAAILLEIEGETGRLVREVERFSGYREPAVPISQGAAQVHGLTLERLRGERLDIARLTRIIASSEYLIAHNAAFDRRMLARLIPCIVEMPWACSIRSVRWKHRGSLSLDALCAFHGIERQTPHSAIADCDALVQLLLCPSGKTARSKPYMNELLANAWVPPY